MPQRKSVPLAWRRFGARYRLEGNYCERCDKKFFPPRSVCPFCLSTDLKPYKFKEEGKVVTYTVIHVAPPGFEGRTPYCIAIIELEDGVRVTGEVVGDISKIKIGARVRAVFRKIFEESNKGIIHYGLKWEVVE